jgi:radical SAM/Cys-rich protein
VISHAALDFDATLQARGLEPLEATGVATLQVNVGKVCNQACKHCHVDAGPTRTELMDRSTAEAVIRAVRRFRIATVDITGGAPELNPSFEFLVAESRAAGAHVIVRHNLTVQFAPGQERLPDLFRAHEVEVTASLPYFLASRTDAQRGVGVFERSIEALRRLNETGYGRDDSRLPLNLVYNPVGAYLPPEQTSIERDFKRELQARYGVTFNRLFTLTNMPINRFRDYLERSGNLISYMQRLVSSFNAGTVAGLMCRTLVSVGWDGRLYDCDFNQMVELPLARGGPDTIFDFDPARLARRRIATGTHCFGCTAGAGSSCAGALAAP